MKKNNCLFTLWGVAICAAGSAHAVGTAPAIFSQYGEIQSVKKYSSNPFWNKDSPYNQNFPKPIYATGADLNTGDCNRIVENLITTYCTEHNYCTNLRISDVRPTIMVQLSQLPGHNFATSCGGYIDSAFENFQKTYGNTSMANLPKTGSQTTNIKIANPFTPKQTAEQKAIAERTAELEQLQTITTPTPTIDATAFPTTTADLSFTDRLANTAAGYEQYKDLPSYRTPTFHDEDEEFFERLKLQNPTEYCKRRPDDTATCPDTQNPPGTTPPNPVTGCPEIANHRDPKTCKCYKSEFMDSADCKCRGISTWDEKNKKCVCPITDTSNLDIPSLAYVQTMCKCPSIKPNYNPTTHRCEEGATPDGETYALLQCRVKPDRKKGVGVRNIGDRLDINFDPNNDKTLACANANAEQRKIDSCFTNCTSGNTKTGKINELLESIGIPKFCTGYEQLMSSGGNPVTKHYWYFSNRNNMSIELTEYNSTQVSTIKQKLIDNAAIVKAHCQDSKRSWIIYVLKKSGSEWIINDLITLD